MASEFGDQWGYLVFRGAVAIAFGILALLWPGITLAALVGLFAAFALLDGVAALMMAFGHRGRRGFWSLSIEGIAGIGAAVVAVLYPQITTVALLAIIAAWAIVTGIAAVVTATVRRHEVDSDPMLPVAGALSVLFGILMLVQPLAGALALVWLIAFYAILSGVTLVALGIRVRQLSRAVARA
jgi:uncharacterized membrane protein HdeD (DUF308 family)